METEEKKHRTGLGAQTLYGMGEFMNGGAFVIINTFFTVFMIKALGMPAALAGTIPLVGKVWDAITDPIMGNITDRTVSKLGAKRLYILIGAFAAAITFVLLWVPLPSENNALLYVFYLVMFCLFSTGFTVLMVPYNGLLPDMIDDYALRSKFSTMRMVWSTLGSMICGLVPTMIIKDKTDASMYIKCAAVFGLLFLLTSLGTFAGTWEKQKAPVRVPMKSSFTQGITCFKSRAFTLFVCIYLAGQCGMDFVSGMAVYYVDDVVNSNGNRTVMGLSVLTALMGVLIVSQLIGMAIWGPVMAKTSKRTIILIGAPIRIISTLALIPFSYAGAPIAPILGLAAGIGIGNAATLNGIFSILSDMADVDELITGVSRPGTVGGMATFARKVAAGVSIGVIGLLLQVVGYDSKIANAGKAQAASTQTGIALVFIIMPIILCALLFLFDYKFPMQKAEFEVIKKEIARRKGEEESTTSPEEKAICEKVTGLAYDKLWSLENTKLGKK